ncbi:MAG: HD-GYP domain-containing protein [Lachnospiraceae bacterium]|nr:HD-GYP domain-containing protein [Lachnospiraceae bacterium]
MKMSKQKRPFIVVIVAILVTILCMVSTSVWVSKQNNETKTAHLSDAKRDGDKFILKDVEIEIRTRGGDSGAWLKDPIYDDAGNELHGSSVGTIYEIVVTNTSNAVLSDWKFELFMPEYLWLNNVWNGHMEIRQTTSGSSITQEVDLGEYTKTDIILDYYIDHTGPMVSMNPGDSFVYIPSEADNEKPLVSSKKEGQGKSYALTGFITYVPDQTIDYVIPFVDGSLEYNIQITVWDLPSFMILVVLLATFVVILVALIVSQIRINKLLVEQKRDAKIIKQSISTFINFIEAKDPLTKGHSQRVAKYSVLLARELGYSELECNRISYIALMHDCGKISIPITILQKKDKLSDDEYEEIKKHTIYGDRMLRDFNSIEGINLGALYHHERYDGKGYPKGLSGEDIPKIARIICVADSLDAMNSDRVYRSKLSKDVIMKELIDNKGKQFDPEIIDCLIKLIDNGEIIIGETDL